jgi:hypothetical protein
MNLGANTAGEPSIGVDLKTGAVMTSSDLQTLKVHFDDSSSPARATWSDISAFTSKDSLDPILFTDRNTGRTLVSQLTGQDSLTSFSDDDGATYTPCRAVAFPAVSIIRRSAPGHTTAPLRLLLPIRTPSTTAPRTLRPPSARGVITGGRPSESEYRSRTTRSVPASTGT